jgi:asparagine synthetase B (glutamine-hydrolysing)
MIPSSLAPADVASSSSGARAASQVCLLVSGGLDSKINIYDIAQQ